MAETPINWTEAFDKLRAWDAEKDRILQALSAVDPATYDDEHGYFSTCFFCPAEPVSSDLSDALQHREDCLWARVRKLFPPAPPEPKVPLKDHDDPGPANPPTNFGTLRLP